MLKLKDIAILNADKYFYPLINHMKEEEFVFLKKYNVRNFEELEDIIIKNIKVPSYFVKLYKLVKNEVEI